MCFNLFKFKSILKEGFLPFCKLIHPSTRHRFFATRITHIYPLHTGLTFENASIFSLKSASKDFHFPRSSNSSLVFLRFYRPDRHIDWVGIKTRWRAKQVLMRKKKHKNHPRVAMRFRLTRFGWERLQSGRNGRKFNLTRQKYKNKMRVKYVSRCDLKKLDRQMPGYRLRIRDPPINNNPNIRNIRRVINSYFG